MNAALFLARLRSWPSSLAYIRKHPVGRRDTLGVVLRMARWHAGNMTHAGLQPHPWVGGSTLLAEPGMTGVTGNIYYGLHEFVEMAFIAMLLRPGDLFGDVGANAGTYSILASKVAGARTVAFEPNGPIRAVLERQLHANAIAGLVSVRDQAIGDHPGSVRFSTALGTMNHIVDTATTQAVEVEMTTLDAAFAVEPPLAIKLDIEGAEDRAIAGAKALLGGTELRAILIETVGDASLGALTGAGFAELFFDPFARTLGSEPTSYPQNNRLFVRDAPFVRERLATAPTLDVLGLKL